MDKQTLIDQTLKTLELLPEDKVHEVADFAEFLLKKKKEPFEDLPDHISQMYQSQLSHLDEEFKDYKKQYPGE